MGNAGDFIAEAAQIERRAERCPWFLAAAAQEPNAPVR